MAECSASLSEEEFSYFCLVCSSKYKERGIKFIRVYYQGSCFTWGTFFNGFKAPKIHSTDMPSHRVEEVFSENEFSYFCFECGNKTQEIEKDFIYVGAVGPC
ncbi:hypothetical protein TNCT_579721 [Trichonephila clavata]|uniref:Uncharacterized protein n=1 Tax=Trichonephila clavata TaxID=2740835 RepID=A0A8X6G4R4_TRICU|nr:hypothetical protein TNCT_579721 [Trichonephila clavata]